MPSVLVTASSRHGSTREISDAIAAGLRARGVSAEAREIDDLEGLEDYDAVVLGSAVYMGRWLRPARAFAEVNAAALAARPLWLFSSGPLGPPDGLVPADESTDSVSLAERLGARDHVVFAGRLLRSDLTRKERLAARIVKAPEADCRDWDAIDAFAAVIATELASAKTT